MISRIKSNENWDENGSYMEYYCDEWILHRTSDLEMGGCMDATFLNYNPLATFDDGTCNNDNCYNDYSNRKNKDISHIIERLKLK